MTDGADVISVLAVADVEVVEDVGQQHFELVGPLFREAAVVFGQLEVPLANSGEPQLHGGIRNWGRDKDPRKGARVLRDVGFHVMSHAGNHTMDMSEQTLSDTLDAVAQETNVKLIGVGLTVEEARQPAILEVEGRSIGFLAYCSVGIKNSWAEERRLGNGRVLRRGGIAPLRAHTYYEQVDYQPANRPRIVSQVYPEDMEAMLEDITKLRDRVDVLFVSMHWGVHFETGTIAQYQVEAGHAAVAAGADAILGHHPHIIKGIEYYNGKPILYGMPNFNLGVRDEHEERDPRWLTLESEKSFIAKFTIASKRIEKLSLIPCHLDGSTRQPEPLSSSDPRTADLIRYLEYVDSHNTPPFWSGTGAAPAFGPFRTKYRLEGDEIVVEP
jgi:poly-gamma-glutamate synthesis protein (capsule biosynthesis protein)